MNNRIYVVAKLVDSQGRALGYILADASAVNATPQVQFKNFTVPELIALANGGQYVLENGVVTPRSIKLADNVELLEILVKPRARVNKQVEYKLKNKILVLEINEQAEVVFVEPNSDTGLIKLSSKPIHEFKRYFINHKLTASNVKKDDNGKIEKIFCNKYLAWDSKRTTSSDSGVADSELARLDSEVEDQNIVWDIRQFTKYMKGHGYVFRISKLSDFDKNKILKNGRIRLDFEPYKLGFIDPRCKVIHLPKEILIVDTIYHEEYCAQVADIRYIKKLILGPMIYNVRSISFEEAFKEEYRHTSVADKITIDELYFQECIAGYGTPKYDDRSFSGLTRLILKQPVVTVPSGCISNIYSDSIINRVEFTEPTDNSSETKLSLAFRYSEINVNGDIRLNYTNVQDSFYKAKLIGCRNIIFGDHVTDVSSSFAESSLEQIIFENPAILRHIDINDCNVKILDLSKAVNLVSVSLKFTPLLNMLSLPDFDDARVMGARNSELQQYYVSISIPEGTSVPQVLITLPSKIKHASVGTLNISAATQVEFGTNITKLGSDLLESIGTAVRLKFRAPELTLGAGAFSKTEKNSSEITMESLAEQLPLDRIVRVDEVYAFEHITNIRVFDTGYFPTYKYAYSFDGSKCETIILNSNINRVGQSPFKNCTQLRNIILHGNIKSIPSNFVTELSITSKSVGVINVYVERNSEVYKIMTSDAKALKRASNVKVVPVDSFEQAIEITKGAHITQEQAVKLELLQLTGMGNKYPELLESPYNTGAVEHFHLMETISKQLRDNNLPKIQEDKLMQIPDAYEAIIYKNILCSSDGEPRIKPKSDGNKPLFNALCNLYLNVSEPAIIFMNNTIMDNFRKSLATVIYSDNGGNAIVFSYASASADTVLKWRSGLVLHAPVVVIVIDNRIAYLGLMSARQKITDAFASNRVPSDINSAYEPVCNSVYDALGDSLSFMCDTIAGPAELRYKFSISKFLRVGDILSARETQESATRARAYNRYVSVSGYPDSIITGTPFPSKLTAEFQNSYGKNQSVYVYDALLYSTVMIYYESNSGIMGYSDLEDEKKVSKHMNNTHRVVLYDLVAQKFIELDTYNRKYKSIMPVLNPNCTSLKVADIYGWDEYDAKLKNRISSVYYLSNNGKEEVQRALQLLAQGDDYVAKLKANKSNYDLEIDRTDMTLRLALAIRGKSQQYPENRGTKYIMEFMSSSLVQSIMNNSELFTKRTTTIKKIRESNYSSVFESTLSDGVPIIVFRKQDQSEERDMTHDYMVVFGMQYKELYKSGSTRTEIYTSALGITTFIENLNEIGNNFNNNANKNQIKLINDGAVSRDDFFICRCDKIAYYGVNPIVTILAIDKNNAIPYILMSTDNAFKENHIMYTVFRFRHFGEAIDTYRKLFYMYDTDFGFGKIDPGSLKRALRNTGKYLTNDLDNMSIEEVNNSIIMYIRNMITGGLPKGAITNLNPALSKIIDTIAKQPEK